MIQIFTTGGTIEGLDYVNDNGLTTSNITIQDFLVSANVDFEYNIDSVFKKDSRAITNADREYLIQKIKTSKADRVLITHGTFTMEDTARYIGIHKLKKTIVMVGSFVLGSSSNTDAPFNMGFAISALQFLDSGVYIAMNGHVFHWNKVSKNLKTNKFECIE